MATTTTLLLLLEIISSAAASAHPGYPEPAECGGGAELLVVRREEYGGGRILDITHAYREDMPGWEMEEGLGRFLWLSKSMDNGSSVAYFSEMKLPAHSGTHVDAPSHVFQRYFEAGFDVDTLDLDLLNVDVETDTPTPPSVTILLLYSVIIQVKYRLLRSHASGPNRVVSYEGHGAIAYSTSAMATTVPLLLLFLLLLCRVLCPAAAPAHPGYLETEPCGGEADLTVVRREEYDGGRILDITHVYHEYMPSWDSDEGLGQFLWLPKSMKNGSLANNSEMKLPAHTGTHVDAPGHVFQHYFEAGFDVDTLDLHVLNGPALLVDVPRDKNITADVMESLHIPTGVRRVLFRTLNTDRQLMWKKEFDTSYVGFMKDGAQWLVDNTDIKLVGIDYLSVAAYDDLIPSHLVFLKSREIILVEALKLDNVKPGIYTLHCLPLRLRGSEGSPIRCILVK
ncbi:hypothetical protein OPV22_010648 [Ensete ventricosum]|uniref:Cyclase n=1 Tax=Ensete ventricosum TaxID=4639 RepID=A0AAV8RLC6_ENSVE|nr:hypothetical protein OPV22_010648 [Ensete ventricosum]